MRGTRSHNPQNIQSPSHRSDTSHGPESYDAGSSGVAMALSRADILVGTYLSVGHTYENVGKAVVTLDVRKLSCAKFMCSPGRETIMPIDQ